MKKIVFILSFCFFSKTSYSQELYTDEISVCEKIQSIAKAAVLAKGEGMTKEFMSTPLLTSSEIKKIPNQEKRIIAYVMHDILNEVFDYDGLEASSYAAYRKEACYLAIGRNLKSKTFENIFSELKNCRSEKKERKQNCGILAARKNIENDS